MARNSNKEIITYDAPWTVYSMSWCRGREDYCSTGFRMAIGSFREEYSNQVQVIQLRDNENSEHDNDVASLNESKAMKRNESSEEVSSSFQPICQFDHPYPPTKICWAPANSASSVSTDLLASSGDYLRLWGIDKDNNAELKRLFNSTKDTDYCAPITSFDWNEVDASIIGAVSMDTTCTIWDINKIAPVAQLIAHDKEVFDIAFANSKDVFGTVSADGQVRMFDLRALEHSTVVYETQDLAPLLRLSWNKQDSNYLATIMTESSKTIILDIRVPDIPVVELTGLHLGHTEAVNAVAWAPFSHHVCTVAEDKQVLIWGLENKDKPAEDPLLQYLAPTEINNVEWNGVHRDWVGICFDSHLQILKI